TAVVRQADRVIAGVDEMDGAGDAGAEVREVVERRTPHVGQLDIAAQWRGVAADAIDVARAADHRAREGAHRAGRARIDPHTLRAEIGREVAHARLEGRL